MLRKSAKEPGIIRHYLGHHTRTIELISTFKVLGWHGFGGKKWATTYLVWFCLTQNTGILVLFKLHQLNYQLVWDII